MPTPEDKAKENIDWLLSNASWAVCNQSHANLLAYRGLAIRNFILKPGHGLAYYFLYVHVRAAGACDRDKIDAHRKNQGKSIPFDKPRRAVAFGNISPGIITSSV